MTRGDWMGLVGKGCRNAVRRQGGAAEAPAAAEPE